MSVVPLGAAAIQLPGRVSILPILAGLGSDPGLDVGDVPACLLGRTISRCDGRDQAPSLVLRRASRTGERSKLARDLSRRSVDLSHRSLRLSKTLPCLLFLLRGLGQVPLGALRGYLGVG